MLRGGGPGRFVLGIRPEALRLSPPAEGLLPAALRRAENLGAEWLLHAQAEGAIPLVLRLTAAEHAAAQELIGPQLWLRALPGGVHLFDGEGRRIPAELLAEVPA
ncbi:MAG: TOBE domain-containing protein [Rhodovarius sp.]|nr:TOBE domain-containing protein [Rhodovarius sp.]